MRERCPCAREQASFERATAIVLLYTAARARGRFVFVGRMSFFCVCGFFDVWVYIGAEKIERERTRLAKNSREFREGEGDRRIERRVDDCRPLAASLCGAKI